MKLFLILILTISISLVLIHCDENNVTDNGVNEDNDTGNGVNLVKVKIDDGKESLI